VASDIQAGSITADRLSVTTLSAISANMGTITAGTITGGTINGATITAGNGTVTLDSNGITATNGFLGSNGYKFTDGNGLFNSGALELRADSNVIITAVGWDLSVSSSGNITLTNGTSKGDLGTSSFRFQNLFLQGDINVTNFPTTTFNDYPVVYSTGNTILYRKTNGFDGTCNSPTSIVIERGIVVGCS
jgi:hypothetical protein